MCGQTTWILIAKIGALIAYMTIEMFLGKTEKTKSGSILELVINILFRRNV